ncbi:MAG: lipid-A-disaccharide synthase [Kiritimatiellia bacterium]
MAGRTLMIIAGEVSGDMLAAGLVRALKKRDPDLRFFGIGGDALRAEGVEVVQDNAAMAVMGFTEVIVRIDFFQRVFERMTELAASRKPAAVILVDYPGFNLRFAGRAHALGLPVIYYVCPQVWAWNRRRVPKMARTVNRLLTIFPFEKEMLSGSGMAVDFVGHPLASAALAQRQAPPLPLPWSGTPCLALLPGSRRHEIDRLLPVMLRSAALLEKEQPGLSCLIATPSETAAGEMRKRLASWSGPRPSRLEVVGGQTRELLKQADAAAVASGTATVETALMRCPMVVVYRTAFLTYLLARLLVKVPFIGMVNLVAGRTVCPELVQNDLTPESLGAALRPLLQPTPQRALMLEGLDDVIRRLGEPGAEERAAASVLDVLATPAG